MNANELHALAAPLLDRIGWPKSPAIRWNAGYAEFQDDIGHEVDHDYTAAVIRCHIEDWWDDNQPHDEWWFDRPTTGFFINGHDQQGGEEFHTDYPEGPTRLHALIAAATKVCDEQDRRGRAYLETRHEMARILREGWMT